MRSLALGLLGALALAACASAPPPSTAMAPASLCTHQGAPPVIRAAVPADCLVAPGKVNWPKADGIAPPGNMAVIIQPGAVLDRYGDGAGNFFSPQGTGYRERSLPYECRGYSYTAYRVVRPLPVQIGTAAPFCGEPGGAVQIKTAECVNQLLAEGALQVTADVTQPACPGS